MELSTKHGNLTQRWIWCDQPTDIHYLSKEQQGVSKTVNGFMAKPGPKNHLLGGHSPKISGMRFFSQRKEFAQLVASYPNWPFLPPDHWNPQFFPALVEWIFLTVETLEFDEKTRCGFNVDGNP
jgi:hypothetical protein